MNIDKLVLGDTYKKRSSKQANRFYIELKTDKEAWGIAPSL